MDRLARRGRPLLAALLLSVGCGLTPQFADMRAQLGELPLPEQLEFVGEMQGGTRPAFFGADPYVMRIYRSPRSLERTCDELQDFFEDRRPTTTRHEYGCTIGFKIGAGWRAKLHGIWRYTGGASAAALPAEGSRLHEAEPPGAYTRVLVTLWDH